MDRLQLYEEMYDLATHNLLCYSEDYLMTRPKANFIEQWKKEREKVDLLEEIIKEEKEKEVDKKISFTQEQILKMYPKVKYQVRNSRGGLLAGTVDLDEAKKYAEKYKIEYLKDSLNKNLGVYVYDKEGKNVYVAKGKYNDKKHIETEEFE